jgi:DNA helicase-2/ATP-dependent DNA helicase PcrA
VQDLNPLQLAIIDLFTNEGATVVYLGDSQQAIFSFMGAKTDTLQLLRQRCQAGCLHNFYENYRSPAYLLQVFNAYGERQLGIGSDLLPVTQNVTPRQPGDLVLMDAATNIDEVNMVARRVRQLYEQHPDETMAVVVSAWAPPPAIVT